MSEHAHVGWLLVAVWAFGYLGLVVGLIAAHHLWRSWQRRRPQV